jgi:hypothetical protein
MLEAGVELFLGGAGRAALEIKFKKKTRINKWNMNFGHFPWINQNPPLSKEQDRQNIPKKLHLDINFM